MAKSSSKSLYDSVVEITADYLGPAAPRFIDRQIEGHLHKKPGTLTKKDLAKLMDWVRISVAMLTDDKQIVNNFMTELDSLHLNNETSKNSGFKGKEASA